MRTAVLATAIAALNAPAFSVASPLGSSQSSASALPEACPSGRDSWNNCVEQDRKTFLIRASQNETDDVSAEFYRGMMSANNGGMLWLEKNKTYMIGKKLELTGLNDVYLKLEGTLKFTDDLTYWGKNNVYHPFQKSISFWKWSGNYIKIFGGGTMDGNGQKWWDENLRNSKDILDPTNTFFRPILMLAIGVNHFDVTNVNFRDSPAWFNFFVESKDIIFDQTTFVAKSKTKARPKNSDGWDTLNVDGLRVTNSHLTVDDDCFSPKPNSTNMHVENVVCEGTHGISMGSIGQYSGVMDYITNVYVKNVTLRNGQNGARIKSWAGKDVGYGYVRNITFTDLVIENTDAPIVLDQCYFRIDAQTCKDYPSRVNASDIRFINIKGTSSGKLKNVVGKLTCSPNAECKNIELKNIDIRNKNDMKKKGVITCDGVKGVTEGACVSSERAKEMLKEKTPEE